MTIFILTALVIGSPLIAATVHNLRRKHRDQESSD